VFDVFQPFALLVAAALLCGYIVLGAAWLHLKGRDALRDFAEVALRWGVPLFMLLSAVTCVAAVYVQPGVRAAWTSHGPALSLISAMFFGALATLLYGVGRKPDGLPFVLVIIAFALGIVGLGITVFPDVVPFRLTLWAAASGTSSHVFLLVGASIVTPIVLAYSAFAYRVFRGKIPAQGWEQ
jgi:cytochrome d ubiquinol oxidase subunit II